MAKQKRKTKPTLINISGDGYQIQATFDHKTSSPMAASIKDMVGRYADRVAASTPPSTAVVPEHDFDVVLRVLHNADLDQLRAFIKVANDQIERFENAPTQNPPPTA